MTALLLLLIAGAMLFIADRTDGFRSPDGHRRPDDKRGLRTVDTSWLGQWISEATRLEEVVEPASYRRTDEQ